MFTPNHGAYPTMITPYNRDGSVDIGAAKALTEWYWRKGCDGIFAVCQSSEIHFLTTDEKVSLAAAVAETARKLAAEDASRPRMTVVASGHTSDPFEEQVAELNAVAETGVDSLILISNRLDIANQNDKEWTACLDRLLEKLPESMPLGIYECPKPYKRLLTEGILDHVTKTGRFAFVKDTCCDAAEMARRTAQIAAVPDGEVGGLGLRPALFNANAQTLLDTLRTGAAGYCGVMANFHPELYVWLTHHYAEGGETVEELAALLCAAAFIEFLTYPAIAKYHQSRYGVPMELVSRSCDASKCGAYDRMCVERMNTLCSAFAARLGL